MFEPQDELSSDLEWMLESGQVDREQIAEALVQEHSGELFRSARLYLRNAGLARQAVEGAIAAALVNVYRYRHGLGVKTWLFRFLIAEWRKMKPAQPDEAIGEWTPVDRQKPRLRELGVLVYAAGFSPADAAKVLGEPEAVIERRIKKLHLNLLLNHGLSASDSGEEWDTLDRRLRAAAQAKVLASNDPPPSADSLISTALANAERRGGRRSGWLRIQEVGLVAVFITLAAMLIWGGNGLLAADQEEHGLQLTQTAAEAALAASSRPTPDYNAGDDRPPRSYPYRRAIPDPEPEPALSLLSTHDEIISKMFSDRSWRRSLWLDAHVRFYYPQDRAGIPQDYRLQLWLDNRRARSLILSGEYHAPIQEIRLDLAGMPYQALRSSDGVYVFQELLGGESDLGYYLATQVLSHPLESIQDGDKLIPVGMTYLLGRSALAVDLISEANQRRATFWIDANTGLVLRQRNVNPDDQSPVLNVDIHEVRLNQPLPEQVFRTTFGWKGNYLDLDLIEDEPETGLDPSTVLWPELAPPPGFDPSDQALFFKFSWIYDLNRSDMSQDALTHRVKLFTESYYLGEINFANPWQAICARSADGDKLAFAEKYGNSNHLYWFSLNEMKLQVYETKGNVTQLAFSPDGKRLAYFSNHPPQGDLHIFNLEQGTQRTLFSMADVRSLVWSPDGRSIGFIGRRTTTGYDDRVMVIDVESGYMFFENSVDFNPERSGEWPPVLWGVDFPVEMGDLRACAQPLANR